MTRRKITTLAVVSSGEVLAVALAAYFWAAQAAAPRHCPAQSRDRCPQELVSIAPTAPRPR
jgi:hypothetical protein